LSITSKSKHAKDILDKYIEFRIKHKDVKMDLFEFLGYLRKPPKPKRSRRRLTPKEREKIKEALSKGIPVKEVAKMFKVSRTTVERIRGVIRPYSLSRERAEKVIKMLVDGVKPKEIAKKLGIALNTVYTIKSRVLHPNSKFYREMHEKYAKYFSTSKT